MRFKAISSRQSAFCILPEASPTMEAGPPGNLDSYHPWGLESREDSCQNCTTVPVNGYRNS